MQKNDTPDLKSVCGHGFEVCFSTECAKPENWSDLLRKRVIEVKHHYEAIKRITEQTRNEIGEAYHRGLNDRGEEVADLKAKLQVAVEALEKSLSRVNGMILLSQEKVKQLDGSIKMELVKTFDGLLVDELTEALQKIRKEET